MMSFSGFSLCCSRWARYLEISKRNTSSLVAGDLERSWQKSECPQRSERMH